jgi:hypothetical protein
MNRFTLLTVISLIGCKPDPERFAVSLSFPDAQPDGKLPYRAGGQFVVEVHADITELTSTHGQISLGGATTSNGVTAPQTVALGASDGGLVGGVVMTWPLGGRLLVYAQVAGVTLPAYPIELVTPMLTFNGRPLQSNGLQWLYPYCLESTTEDGNVALHLDGAALPGGTSDTMLALAAGPCEGTASAARSHASYTAVPSLGTFRATATMSGIPHPFPQGDVIVKTFVAPKITVTSPQITFPGGAIIQVDIHVDTGPEPAQGIAVQLQAIPPTPGTMVVPSMVTTNANGDASAHFQMPMTGSVEIDASIGPIRGSKQF